MYILKLIGCLIILLIMFNIILSYVFKYKKDYKFYLISNICMIMIIIIYYYYGNWNILNKYNKQQAQFISNQQLLKKYKNIDQIIIKLKHKVTQNKNDSYGWYLLGKLYLHQNKLILAKSALYAAYKLQTTNEQYAVAYLLVMWELNTHQINNKIINILNKILYINKNQPDALAIAAINAYQHKNNALAIKYWNQLLLLVPENSKTAQAIQRAIIIALRNKIK